MKLIRFGEPGFEKPGIIDDNNVRRDLSGAYSDWDRSFFNSNGIERLKNYLDEHKDLPEVPENVRWAACVARPGKVLCIGLNYSDHAAESGMPVPKEPILFQKGSNTVVGPFDPIIIPKRSEKTDWEVELGVIIGKDARYLESEDESAEYIGGYCVANDVSERAFQLEMGGQWTKGKSCDNFTPLGPFMLTADKIPDPNNLSMSLSVNGQSMQKGNTDKMVFDVKFLIHYLSQFMTLEAGDVILTGTPPGVGLGMKPPVYLREGDVVELSVEFLGSQKQTCIQA